MEFPVHVQVAGRLTRDPWLTKTLSAPLSNRAP